MKTFDIFADERLMKSDLFVVDLPLRNSTKKRVLDVLVNNDTIRTDIIIEQLQTQGMATRVFDVPVGNRSVRCELIVSNLPIRDDIVAFYRLHIGAQVKDVIAEKVLSHDEKSGGIVIYAEASSAAIKNIAAENMALTIDAGVTMSMKSAFGVDTVAVVIEQAVRDVLQKFTDASAQLLVCTTDELNIVPQKSLGKPSFDVVFGADAAETKMSYVDSEMGVGVSSYMTDPDTTYYAAYNDSVAVCADVHSLSFLANLRNAETQIIPSANVLGIDIYGSFGKLGSQVEPHANISFTEEQFTEVNSEVIPSMFAEECAEKAVTADNTICIYCSAEISMHRARTLEEVDEMGTLANIDTMALEELCYVDIN